MDDNFANAPKSIDELRSDRTDSCTDILPRSLLIQLLREIDGGALEIDALVIGFRLKPNEGKPALCGFRASAPSGSVALGVFELAKMKFAGALS